MSEKDRSMLSKDVCSSENPIVKDEELVEQTLSDSEWDLKSKEHVVERFFKGMSPEKQEPLWRAYKYLRDRSLMALNASSKELKSGDLDISMEEFMIDLREVISERRFRITPYGKLEFNDQHTDHHDEDESTERIPSVVKLSLAQIIISGAMSDEQIEAFDRWRNFQQKALKERESYGGYKLAPESDGRKAKLMLGEIGSIKYYDEARDETLAVYKSGKMISETGHIESLNKRTLIGPHPQEIRDSGLNKMISSPANTDKDK